MKVLFISENKLCPANALVVTFSDLIEENYGLSLKRLKVKEKMNMIIVTFSYRYVRSGGTK